jgi:hypothetical protein
MDVTTQDTVWHCVTFTCKATLAGVQHQAVPPHDAINVAVAAESLADLRWTSLVSILCIIKSGLLLQQHSCLAKQTCVADSVASWQ